ncbi:hypothetical protein TrVE_jg1772 [Triparma verrucosa]|uniref:Uncharacterized protein n=1 Tax=Triparma verrucosa TaxID=1606542 RepID=A0A9W7KUF8_9STRA|nr:hypothetical protein TrVE_jg1772 [Triparma verrucosa]
MNKSRRPSWGDRSQALSFYSGKTPANAGVCKKQENKRNVLNAPKPGAPAQTPQTDPERIPIPDYAKKKKATVPEKPAAAAEPKNGKRLVKGKPKRPSLSEQLASIGAQASNLTASIKQNAGMEADQSQFTNDEPPLLTSPSKSFKVGSLECKYPSPVLFYKDRCVYTYHHPFQPKEILMVMRYADMSQPQLTKPASRIGNVRFRFKVMRDFEQFKGVYGPGDWIEISFNTTSDYDNVKELVLPLCMGKKRK